MNWPCTESFNSRSQCSTGKFNGDGLDDLAVTTAADVQIYLNSGKLAGLFTPGASIPLAASSLIGGDFNGDGIPDLAMVIAGNQIAVVLGNGDGTFSAPIVTPSAGTSNGFTVQIFAGDFNGDGKLDLVTTFNGLLFGNGDGTFQAPRPFVSAKMLMTLVYIGTIVPVDLNNDGRMDLAVYGSDAGGELFGFINSGKGVFTPMPGAPLSFVEDPVQAVTGDFNGDGIPDIVVTGGFEVMACFGLGDGTFSATPYHSPSANPLNSFGVDANDLNLDGKEDIVVTGGFPQGDAIRPLDEAVISEAISQYRKHLGRPGANDDAVRTLVEQQLRLQRTMRDLAGETPDPDPAQARRLLRAEPPVLHREGSRWMSPTPSLFTALPRSWSMRSKRPPFKTFGSTAARSCGIATY